MADIPRAVLSEHFQEKMKGKRLISAVFLTFRFDPAFFEQEILPVFFDIPLNHTSGIKLAQLDDALRSVSEGLAVFFDQNGLLPEAGSPKLDIRRIAVRHMTGIFHPKNIFALCEDLEPDKSGRKARSLLVASLSANLTRAGWWENVEVCHSETIKEGQITRLRQDIIDLIKRLKRNIDNKTPDSHASLNSIQSFLLKTEQRDFRSFNGFLYSHFYNGSNSVPEFLKAAAGDALKGMNLEIISPYFDTNAGTEVKPLMDLIAGFMPREVRVYLPRKDSGEARCSKDIFEQVKKMPGVSWGRLPNDVLSSGKGKELKNRFVHAKVYRFFNSQKKCEIFFVGSANLTRAAHQNGGNLETGFLIEIQPAQKPDWWLETDSAKPGNFLPGSEDEGATSGGTRLSIRFYWNDKTAQAYWDDNTDSPRMELKCKGVKLFELNRLPPKTWETLSPDRCDELHRVLKSTSIMAVHEDGREQEGFLLVQEEGMAHKPSILLELSPAEILKYWSLLTDEQRAHFIEVRIPELIDYGDDPPLFPSFPRKDEKNTFFDHFSGLFPAFGWLERKIGKSLKDGNIKDVTYSLFGNKYDSLGNLLNRVLHDDDEGEGDAVEHYLIFLCAHQLIEGMKREYDPFWKGNIKDGRKLAELVGKVDKIRAHILGRNLANMPAFLEWFERRFLIKATPVSTEQT